MPEPVCTGPAFGQAASHVSDVQLRHALSPDGRSNTVLFDNLTLRLLPGGPPIVTRALSVVFPLARIVTRTPIGMQLRGGVSLLDGARATLVLRVLGTTHVLDPLLGPGKASHTNYIKTLTPVAGPGDDLSITLLMSLERQAGQPTGEGLLSVDSVDMTLTPPS